jgi:nucleotide-binding universal stress UspA family protein
VKEAEALGHPERPFSPILVPVDFSPYSMRALERAADLAERFDAMMVVLHVIDSEMGVQALASHLGKSLIAPEVYDNDEVADISDDDIKMVLYRTDLS